MKRLKISSFFLSLLFILGCSQRDPYDYEVIADQITKQTILQLEKEKGLIAIGTGGGMMGDIYNMGISFQYFQPLNLEESRKLLVYTVQTYLNNINSNKEVRPYLHNYPFPIKNIEIRIWGRQPNGDILPPNQLGYICALDGVLSYESSKSGKFEPRKILLEETYEEALKIVEENP